jgi:ribosome maturation factor RimP
VLRTLFIKLFFPLHDKHDSEHCIFNWLTIYPNRLGGLSSLKTRLSCFCHHSIHKPARRRLSFGRQILLITENLIKEYLTQFVIHPIVIYSLKVNYQGKNSLIEINLDNLQNSYGAVTIGDCEQVSRDLRSILEEKQPEENYTLKVSSAGAERDLRLPGDLKRFSHLPLRLKFESKEGLLDEVVKIVRLEGEEIELEKYSKKISKNTTKYLLQVSDITKGNLYLDI